MVEIVSSGACASCGFLLSDGREAAFVGVG